MGQEEKPQGIKGGNQKEKVEEEIKRQKEKGGTFKKERKI